MPNNRFNKQVTPKGYKRGGSVKEEPMRDRMKQPLKTKAGPRAGRTRSPFGPDAALDRKRKAGPKAGRPKPSIQQKRMGAGAMSKRKKPDIILLKGVKEGPAKRFTTIKEIPLNLKSGIKLDPLNFKRVKKMGGGMMMKRPMMKKVAVLVSHLKNKS